MKLIHRCPWLLLFCSATKSCLILCEPMDCSTPGFPVLHYLSVCSNSCPLNWWCCLIISFSAALFSFWCQSFPASGSFPVSWLFGSGGQSTGTSASARVFIMIIQGWFPLWMTGLISLHLPRNPSRNIGNMQTVSSSLQMAVACVFPSWTNLESLGRFVWGEHLKSQLWV